MVDFPRIPDDLIQQLRGIFFAKDRSPILSSNNWIGQPLINTPSVNPPVDNLYIYPKSDKELYRLDWDGVESLISSQIKLIEEIELSESVSSVSFNNIPQNFRNLLLVIMGRTDRAAEVDGVYVRFNDDSGSNYDRQRLRANSVTATGDATRNTTTPFFALLEAANSDSDAFSHAICFIPEYSNQNIKKSLNCFANSVFGDISADTDLFINLEAVRWDSKSPISSMEFFPQIGLNFVTDCVFQLYGLL